MNVNRNPNTFIKYALFICLSFLCSSNQIYSQINSDDSYDLDSAIKNHNKVFSEKEDANSSIIINKIEPWTFSGSVVNVVNENNIVVKHNDREIMLKFIKKEASGFNVGDSVTVTCIPYRENPNKVILAKGMKIKESDGQFNSQTNIEGSLNLQNKESLRKESKRLSRSERVVKGKNSSTSFRMNRNCVISGEISEIISDNNILIKYDGREILVKFREKVSSNLEVGDKVSFTCNAYRENPNGVILANGSEIAKEE